MTQSPNIPPNPNTAPQPARAGEVRTDTGELVFRVASTVLNQPDGRNQDAWIDRQDKRVFAVLDTDGPIGAPGQIASETIEASLDASALDYQPDDVVKLHLTQALANANQALFNDSSPSKGRTSATVVMPFMGEDGRVKLAGISIGNTRAYLLRSDTARQLSVDETLAQKRIDEKGMPLDEALDHELPQAVTNALGEGPDIEINPENVFIIELEPGDRFMLCTHGIGGDTWRQQLTDDELQIIGAQPGTLQAAALTRNIVAQPGKLIDDKTAVIFDVLANEPMLPTLAPVNPPAQQPQAAPGGQQQAPNTGNQQPVAPGTAPNQPPAVDAATIRRLREQAGGGVILSSAEEAILQADTLARAEAQAKRKKPSKIMSPRTQARHMRMNLKVGIKSTKAQLSQLNATETSNFTEAQKEAHAASIATVQSRLENQHSLLAGIVAGEVGQQAVLAVGGGQQPPDREAEQEARWQEQRGDLREAQDKFLATPPAIIPHIESDKVKKEGVEEGIEEAE